MGELKKNLLLLLGSLVCSIVLIEVVSFCLIKFTGYRIQGTPPFKSYRDFTFETKTDWAWLDQSEFQNYIDEIRKLEQRVEGESRGEQEIFQSKPKYVVGAGPGDFKDKKSFDEFEYRTFGVKLWTKENRKKIYEAEYVMDKYFRRYHPEQNEGDGPGIVLLGGSFVFGEGLPLEKTLSGQVMSYSKNNYRVYNFGYFGYGPTDILFNLKEKSLNYYEGVKRVEKIIYAMPFFHLDRALGPSYIFNKAHEWLAIKPRYRIDANNKLILDGQLKDAPGGLLYSFFNKTNFYNYFGVFFPLYWSKKDISLVTSTIKEIQLESKKRLPKAEFYIMLYPAWPDSVKAEMISNFKGSDVKVIDFGSVNVRLLSENSEVIPIDRHPSAIMNSILAQGLVRKLDL